MFTPLAFNKENIVTRGLVFAVDAADRSSYSPGSGVWNDLTGNGNNGTLVNGPTFDGANGGSIVFDGTNDYIQLNNSLPIKWQNLNQISLEVTFKFNSLSTSRQYIFDSRYEVTQPYNWYVLFVDPGGELNIGIGNYQGGNFVEERYFINNNQIYTVTFIIDKTTTTNNVKLYIDGILVISSSYDFTANQGSEENSIIYIGRAYPDNGYRLYGNIYNFRIYKNKTLTPSEISQNYNALKSRFNL